MYIDYQNLFSNRQALASGVSEHVLDVGRRVGAWQHDIGPGYPIEVLCVIAETAVGATGLTVELQTSDTADFTDAITLQSAALTDAEQLVAGMQVPLSTLPVGCKRYLRLKYTVTGTATAGQLIAGLVLDRQTNGGA